MTVNDPFDEFESFPSVSGNAKCSILEANLSSMNAKALSEHLQAQYQNIKKMEQSTEEISCIFSKEYASQLLSDKILESSCADVVALSACILAGALRMAAPRFPFSQKSLGDAFKLFRKMLNLCNKPCKNMQSVYMSQFLQCLSDVHIMYALCKFATENTSVDKDVQEIAKELILLGRQNNSMLSPIASIMTDMMIATPMMSDGFFELVINEFTQKSPIVNLMICSHAKQLQHVIHDYIMNSLSRNLKAYTQAQESSDGRRKYHKSLQETLALVQKLAKVNAAYVRMLMPSIIKYTNHDDPEMRLLLVKALGKVLEDRNDFLQDSMQATELLCIRFSDTKPAIRNEMLRIAYKMLSQNQDTQHQQWQWNTFAKAFVEKLVDPDEAVRKNCVLMATSLKFSAVPHSVQVAVGERCRDKKTSVRNLAITQLAKCVDRAELSKEPAWIPNAILHTYYADDESNMNSVELALFTMIEGCGESISPLCTHLDSHSTKIVRDIFSRMHRVRSVVIRLIQISQESSQDDNVSKLLLFLAKQLPLEGFDALEEWKAVARTKDRKFLREVQDCLFYAKGFQETLHYMKRVWKKSTWDYVSRVLHRFSLPIKKSATSLFNADEERILNREKDLRTFYLLRVYEPKLAPNIICIAEELKAEMQRQVSAPNVNLYSSINLALELLCEPCSQSEQLHNVVKSRNFIHTLLNLCLSLHHAQYTLIKTSAKAIAMFLDPKNQAYEEWIGLVQQSFVHQVVSRRISACTIYRKLIEAGSVVAGKQPVLVNESLITSLRVEAESPTDESALLYHVLNRLVQVCFESQTCVHTGNVFTFMSTLVQLADKQSFDGEIKKLLYTLKALIRLLRSPMTQTCMFDNIQTLQNFANILCKEECKETRLIIQKKFYKHLRTPGAMPLQCTAFLLICALTDAHRSSIARSRDFLRNIIQKYRSFVMHQSTGERITLSDEKALSVYPEYIFPLLLYLLAHSPVFVSEGQSSFPSIQRAFYLFFEEVIGPANESASFLYALIHTMRVHDDRYNPASLNAKILCDVALRDLAEVLKTRSIHADSLFSYPGAIKLPHFFAKSSKNSPTLETEVLLQSDFSVIRIGPGGSLTCTDASKPKQEALRITHDLDEETLVADAGVQRITSIVQEKYGSMNSESVALLSWKTIRRDMASALQVDELDDFTRKVVWEAIEKLHENES